MDMSKEREAFSNWFKSNFSNGEVVFGSDGVPLGYEKALSWSAWQAAKASAVPKNTKTVYLVWNESGDECVGFTDKSDAKYASTGYEDPHKFGVSYLASQFRDVYEDYADENEFEITEIVIEAAQGEGHD